MTQARGSYRAFAGDEKCNSGHIPADDAQAPMKALALAFADTVEMVADGAIPNDAGLEFVAVLEARLAGLGYRVVRIDAEDANG